MRKIDILNFITDFRKSPNDIKTLNQIVDHLGTGKESQIKDLMAELIQNRVVRETEMDGEKAYQVVAK